MKAAQAHPWMVLAGLALGVTVTNSFARFAYGLILPAMKSEMDWTYAQAGWLNTANALGYIVGAVITMLLIGRRSPTLLFAFGLITTTIALLATGLNAALWWQTMWRILAGLFGAMSFSTAGVLVAGLFKDSPRHNALAIAILFGTGGGVGIVLAGAALPGMLDHYGNSSWPMAWVTVGAVSVSFLPLSLWAAAQLSVPVQIQSKAPALPIRQHAGPNGRICRVWPWLYCLSHIFICLDDRTIRQCRIYISSLGAFGPVYLHLPIGLAAHSGAPCVGCAPGYDPQLHCARFCPARALAR